MRYRECERGSTVTGSACSAVAISAYNSYAVRLEAACTVTPDESYRADGTMAKSYIPEWDNRLRHTVTER